MRKALRLFSVAFLFLLCGPRAWSQERVVQAWLATYDGPARNHDGVSAVAVDRAGNVHVTGGSQTGLQYERPFAGGQEADIATVKYDRAGNLLWVARFDGDRSETEHDESSAIALDGFGGVYVTGHTGVAFESDFITIKYGADGAEEWVARHGVDFQTDHARGIKVDDEGSAYVTGSFLGYRPYIVTLKYSTQGDVVWTAEHHAGDDDFYTEAQALALAPPGRTIVLASHCQVNSPHFCDILLLVYDEQGNLIQATQERSPDTDEQPVALGVDGDGGIYTTSFCRVQGEEAHVLTSKHGPTGQKLWLRNFGAGDDALASIPVGLALDPWGNACIGVRSCRGPSCAYVALKYDARGALVMNAAYDDPETELNEAGAMALDPDGAVYLTGNSGNTGGGRDLLTVKFGRDGGEAWAARLRRNFSNSGDAIAVAGDGRVVVAGETDGDFLAVQYVQPAWTRFWRGDVDADGARNLADAVSLLDFLFLEGRAPPCRRSADANDDGALGLTDAVFLLNYLFEQGPGPDAGSPGCARDSTPDPLDCWFPGVCA